MKPPCCDCGKPVYSWVGRPDATDALCFDCWDRRDDAEIARAERRARFAIRVLVAVFFALVILDGFLNGWS